MIWFWLAVGIIAFIIEALTYSLVSIWFAGGALVAILTNLLGLPVYSQIMAFFAASILFFAFAKTWMESHLATKDSHIPTNLDRLIGKTGKVTQIIRPNEGGRVEVEGMDWKAIDANNGKIEINQPVKVVAISGVKLEVIPVRDLRHELVTVDTDSKDSTPEVQLDLEKETDDEH